MCVFLQLSEVLSWASWAFEACQERRRELLATKPGTDVVEAEMSLTPGFEITVYF